MLEFKTVNCVVSPSEEVFIFIHFCLLFLGHSLFCCSPLPLLSKTESTAQPDSVFHASRLPSRKYNLYPDQFYTHTVELEVFLIVHPVLAKGNFSISLHKILVTELIYFVLQIDKH